MSIQKILEIADEITINRRKMTGVQFTRNQSVRITQTPTRNPWRFSVHPTASLPYYKARSILERLDVMDRVVPEEISFSSNPNLSWMFRYQGDLNDIQLSNLQISSFIGTNLILKFSPDLANELYFFKSGDVVQIRGYPYPFTVTEDVLGSSRNDALTTITLKTHRPNFITGSLADLRLNYGANCLWKVIATTMPTYKLVQGATTYSASGALINNARVEFSNDLELYEYITI